MPPSSVVLSRLERSVRVPLLACAALFLGACGPGDNDGGRADLSASPSDMAARDLAGTGDGGASGDGGDCPSPPSSAYRPYLRVMALTQTATPRQGGTTIGWGTVGYSTGTAVVPQPRSCTFTPAPPPGPPLPNAMEVHESAGVITIAGGTHTVVMAPGAGDDYIYTDSAAVWPGNAALGIDIAGACDVPASHFDLVMPKSVTAMTPTANAVVSRSSDLAVTWTAGSGDLSFDLANASGHVHCVFDAAAGTGTVPAGVVGQLAAGDSSYDLGLSNRILTTKGGRVYLIEADTDVLQPDGSLFVERRLKLQ